MLQIQFPEDHLTLLGPEVSTLAPDAFYQRILGLFQERMGRKEKAIAIKGKKAQTATKKRLGVYELSYVTALGERRAWFEFDSTLHVATKVVTALCEKLLCTDKMLTALLEKKKFVLCTCAEHEDRLLEKSLEASANGNSNSGN